MDYRAEFEKKWAALRQIMKEREEEAAKVLELEKRKQEEEEEKAFEDELCRSALVYLFSLPFSLANPF